jgi:hypothetical protein
VVETSLGNFQAWLKHDDVYPAPLSTFIAQTLAKRYGADPSAADWRRFGRLPGFTNCKPKYRRATASIPTFCCEARPECDSGRPPTCDWK